MRTLSEEDIKSLKLLDEMYNDSYFPNHLVDRIKQILLNVCKEIESQKPQSDSELYAITHPATERINDLEEEFDEAESELETVARDCIGESFEKVAHAYGFDNADIEELIAPRDW